ncbi:hypothetical protein ACKXF8_08190 [Faecalibacterium prausnitzii]|uniref:hypothetical protein n=1 Tax=Faecalibacterium prausnitzii TaxID=853 RepID=UPI003C2B79E8
MLSYRKLAMRVLGRPFHTGRIDSPRPASQRAAAFILTAAMLTTLAAPAFADIWHIENGDITISAGESGNNVTQNNNTTYGDTNTIITNQNKDTASSHTVTIEAKDKDDKVEVTLKDVNIDTSSRNKAAVSVTGEGDTNIKLDGDNALKSDIYRSGIYGSGSGSLTISGGENDSLTAQGGSGANGISSSGSLTISGGTVTANGDDGGRGISSSGSVTISGGSTVTANGGSGTISGGDGIWSGGGVTISGGSTVTANGGNGGSLVGGDGIRSGGGLTVSDGTVTAKGGNGDSKDGYGGDGIRSGGVVTISGNTVNAAGGYGGKVGGYGICSFDRVAISGGTVEAAGGNGSTGGGSGIYSSVIDLSGSLELTAKAGSPNGKALSQRGSELVLDTIKDKLGPGAKVTATDADGKVIDQVPIPRPVEPEKPVIPEESSSSSDGGSATPSAPASPLPGLTVTDKDGQRISYTSTQSGNTLTVCVGRLTASFRISLAALRQLRAEGIETITFQTILCSTTLSVDELLAMGGEDAEAVLTHRFTDSSLTVG